MILAGASLNQIPIDWKNNLSNILEAIKLAQEENVDFLCLPELCITGYGCEDLFFHEWVYEKAKKVLLEIVPHTQNITVCIGLPYKVDDHFHNTACVLHNGEILGFVAKQFLANDGIHYEHRWFTPWLAEVQTDVFLDGKMYPFGDITFDINGERLGFEICEDAWRKNRPGIRLAKKHVTIIFNPSASHFAFHKTDVRKKLATSSSKEFNCWYVYANLLGNESGKVIYDGETLIAKDGVLYQYSELLSFKNVVLTTYNTDSGIIPSYQSISKESEFEKAVSLALFDYLRKSKTKSFVLSLSGGADSSACAVLVSQMIRNGVEEIGLEAFCSKLGINVPLLLNDEDVLKALCQSILVCAYQGTKNSSSDTFDSAKTLADSIGATFYSWLIDEEIASYTAKIEKAIGRDLSWLNDDIALQNIQARTRSPIIWLLTNLSKSLLITTSNRSEGDVGYATMDGDTSGSIAPIAGVDKHFIRNWLLWAERELNYSGLNKVNALQPSAELRPLSVKQTDEEDLMPYETLLQIERLAIFEFKSPLEVFDNLYHTQQFDKESLKKHIRKFFKLWSINQWKRERLAPSFHLDDFNVDPRTWCRFPILCSGFEQELTELDNL